MNEQIKGLIITSILLVIVGLFAMFLSVSMGATLGENWLIKQQDGFVDTSHYMLIVDTYTNNFVVLGCILVSAGILVGIITYFTFIILGKKTKEV